MESKLCLFDGVNAHAAQSLSLCLSWSCFGMVRALCENRVSQLAGKIP